MPPYKGLGDPLDPSTTVLLAVECQEGVVGTVGAMPRIAEAARTSGALDDIALLVDAAYRGGVQVIHALADGRHRGGARRLPPRDGRHPRDHRRCAGP
ncbi:hypothetical protein GCM10027073_63240 [Streptomyces chlorus]